MKKDYSRSISLICPVCASGQFKFDDALPVEERKFTCAGCGGEFSRDDVVDGNGEKIENEISEMKREIVSDIRKDFSKIFKKFK